MKLLVLAVGRARQDCWSPAEDEYRKRLRRYADVAVADVKDDAALLKALPPRARLVMLDERGELWSSDELARRVADWELRGAGAPVVFAIGGAEGWSLEVPARADHRLAFGRITLPHRLARVLCLEQIYRAYTILRGEPYHK